MDSKQIFFSAAQPYEWYSEAEPLAIGAMWYNPTTRILLRYSGSEWLKPQVDLTDIYRKFYETVINR